MYSIYPDEGANGRASGDKEDLIVSGTGEATESNSGGGGVGLGTLCSPVATTVPSPVASTPVVLSLGMVMLELKQRKYICSWCIHTYIPGDRKDCSA